MKLDVNIKVNRTGTVFYCMVMWVTGLLTSYKKIVFLAAILTLEQRPMLCVCSGVWRCVVVFGGGVVGCGGVWRCCSGVWSWCSGVWRRVEGCGGGVVVCGGVWRGVEVV